MAQTATGTIGTVIQTISGPSLGYAEGLLGSIEATRFARMAKPGGVEVTTNHPAWQIGHLSIYPAKVAEACGLTLEGVANSERYLELFEAGSDCRDDPDGSIYPSKDELMATLTDGYRKLIDAAVNADDETLSGLHAGSERMRERFPTRGGLIAFMVSGHFMMHMGQVSAWRRCEGLGPVF